MWRGARNGVTGWRFDSVGGTASGETRGGASAIGEGTAGRRAQMPGRGTERRGVGRRDGGEREKQRGMGGFIVRESGESALGAR